MKTFVRLLTLLVIGVSLSVGMSLEASSMHEAWGTNYTEAFKDAKLAGKGVIVLVSAEWCGPCKKLKGRVFNQQAFIDAMKGRVELTVIEVTRANMADTLKITGKLNVKAFPTVILFDKDLKEIGRKVGSGGSLKSHIEILQRLFPKVTEEIRNDS